MQGTWVTACRCKEHERRVQVYKGRRKYTGLTVAMKFILKHGKSERDISALRSEIEILRGLHHENIIELLDFFETAQEFCLITEFAQGVLSHPSLHGSTVSSSHHTGCRLEHAIACLRWTCQCCVCRHACMVHPDVHCAQQWSCCALVHKSGCCMRARMHRRAV